MPRIDTPPKIVPRRSLTVQRLAALKKVFKDRGYPNNWIDIKLGTIPGGRLIKTVLRTIRNDLVRGEEAKKHRKPKKAKGKKVKGKKVKGKK